MTEWLCLSLPETSLDLRNHEDVCGGGDGGGGGGECKLWNAPINKVWNNPAASEQTNY